MSRFVLGGLALLALALLTSARVDVFQNERSLWTDAYATAPAKPRVLVNLAGVAIADGEDETAAAWLDRADAAAAVRSGWERAHAEDLSLANRALLAMRSGRSAEALQLLTAHLDAAHTAVGVVCRQFGCLEAGR